MIKTIVTLAVILMTASAIAGTDSYKGSASEVDVFKSLRVPDNTDNQVRKYQRDSYDNPYGESKGRTDEPSARSYGNVYDKDRLKDGLYDY